QGEKSTPMDELDWWAKCSSGVIDPRPKAMTFAAKHFDRILHNGGVFVIFSDAREEQELVYGQHHEYHGLSIQQKIPRDNWSFLPIFSNLSITSDFGQEITPARNSSPLVKLLADHLEGAAFTCTFQP